MVQLGIGQTIILALTFAALVWYAAETMRLRKTTEAQLRLAALPIIRLSLNLAPPKVFLCNVGTGIAMRTLLQGFRFQRNGTSWRCTFESTEVILPGQEIPIDFEIEREPVNTAHEQWSDPNIIFQIAFRNAIGIGRLYLRLYVMDALGSCHESEVAFSWGDFTLFMEFGKPQPRTSRSQASPQFPDSVRPAEGVPLDATPATR
jgi:hypothetical protein